MTTRILTEKDVYALLPMKECMGVMEETLKTVARGDAVNPLRTALRLPGHRGLLGLMPAYLGHPESTGIKVITVMPGNHGTEFDAHQGTVLLFEAEHGCLKAIMDASSITAIRTAAVSGVATKLLAREDSRTLAILGSGVQARTHLEAMLRARDLSKIRVWSRTGSSARRFAERESDRHKIPIAFAESAREAVDGADIICTTTAAEQPVLNGSWISPGTHINAVGACVPKCRELDTEAVQRSRLFVDLKESAVNEAGDFLIPRQEGAIQDDHIVGEIGAILLGKLAGRKSDEEITLFKSLGIAAEDLGTADYLYRKAVSTQVGLSVEFGGRRQ